jgi:GTP-binding protein
MRYLERSLRENVGFKGTPIKLLMRGKAVVGTKDKNSD